MVIAIGVLLFLLVLLMALVFLTQRHVIDRLDSLELEIRRLKPDTAPDAVKRLGLGRTWPTPDELTAARNRIDQVGTAHPGSADPNIRAGG